MPPNDLLYQTDDIYSPVCGAGDKCVRFHQTASDQARSIWKISPQPRDLQNWEEASTKLREERKLTNTCTWCQNRKKKRGEKSIPWPQERATVAYVKYQITITFTSLPEAHDSIIWADTTYYRLRVMDVVCLFCGQFAELMVFAVRYERKQNGIIWRLSFLPTSFVQYCGAIQFNHESREM